MSKSKKEQIADLRRQRAYYLSIGEPVEYIDSLIKKLKKEKPKEESKK